MSFYRGTTADGSDIEHVRGLYISLDGNEWSTKEYPHYTELDKHLEKYNRTLEEEKNLILQKKSLLPRSLREWIIKHYEALNPNTYEEDKIVNDIFGTNI